MQQQAANIGRLAHWYEFLEKAGGSGLNHQRRDLGLNEFAHASSDRALLGAETNQRASEKDRYQRPLPRATIHFKRGLILLQLAVQESGCCDFLRGAARGKSALLRRQSD